MKCPFADLPSAVFFAVNGSLLEELGKITLFLLTQSCQKLPGQPQPGAPRGWTPVPASLVPSQGH